MTLTVDRPCYSRCVLQVKQPQLQLELAVRTRQCRRSLMLKILEYRRHLEYCPLRCTEKEFEGRGKEVTKTLYKQSAPSTGHVRFRAHFKQEQGA